MTDLTLAPAHGVEAMIEAGGWYGQLSHVLEWAARIIDLIGIGIILLGFVVSLLGLVLCLTKGLGLRRHLHDLHNVRLQLGAYILVGLEFMIASDIIHTVITRELRDLAFVAALVAIRTAIGFFLGRELAEAEKNPHGPNTEKTA